MTTSSNDRVVSDAAVLGGELRIRGTRIQLSVILDSLAEGFTPAEIVDHYSPLTEDDIKAALTYFSESRPTKLKS